MKKKEKQEKEKQALESKQQLESKKKFQGEQPKKLKRSIKFYVAYVFAILAWFGYSSIQGIDMLSWTKSQQWHAKGLKHQSGKYYSHK